MSFIFAFLSREEVGASSYHLCNIILSSDLEKTPFFAFSLFGQNIILHQNGVNSPGSVTIS